VGEQVPMNRNEEGYTAFSSSVSQTSCQLLLLV